MGNLIQNEYFQFLLIVIGSAVFAKAFHFALAKYVKRITEKTKTDIDDIILRIITKPLYVLIILIGSYFGLKTLSEIERYFLWIDRIFFASATLTIFMMISKILSLLISRWLKNKQDFEKTPKLIIKIVNVVIYLIAILIILNYFGIEITPIVASLGIGGLAIGLALQSTLSNFFAGLHIISDRPVAVGDFIELEGGISGFVEDIGWRSTKIRTLPNNIVIIPNSKLSESTITNQSIPQLERSTIVQCGVSYDSDLDKVEKVTIGAAREIQKTIPGAVKTFEPLVRFHTFADSNINFSIILRVEAPTAKFLVTHEFIKALKKKYDQEGIEISWPVMKIYREK